jgi:accessory gene regulator B
MFTNLAKDIAFLLIKNKVVDIKKRDVYVYGLEVIILNFTLLAIALGISLLSGAFMHFVMFVVVFLPLRVFAGGYHAKTSERCLVLSTLLYSATVAIVRLFPLLYESIYATSAGIIFAAVIFALAPLVSKNNELNESQVKRNRLITRVLLIVNIGLFAVCYWQGWTIASSAIVLVGFVCVLLVFGKIMGKFEKGE